MIPAFQDHRIEPEKRPYRQVAQAFDSDRKGDSRSQRRVGTERFLSEDPAALELAIGGTEVFMERAASKILSEHGSDIFLNNCPRCGKLAKTPKARQCRFC